MSVTGEVKIRSQVVVLRVFYDADEDDPSQWNWEELLDEPVRPAVEVLAAGPVVDHPAP